MFKGIDKKQNRISAFWKNVVRVRGGCFEWTGCKTQHGYGSFYFDGWKASHRVSWMIHHGKVPKGLCVLHRCDNPSCVRESHLFLGTHKENMLDKVRKGRQTRGENINLARLTEPQVLEIRKLKGVVSQLKIAEMFKTNRTNVWYIQTYRTWKHV